MQSFASEATKLGFRDGRQTFCDIVTTYTRRNAALLSLQHPCRFKSRSKSISDCCKPVFGHVLRGVKRCRMWLTPDKLGTLQARVAACSAVLPSAAAMRCPLRNFEEMCGAERIQPKTPGLLRVLRD